MDRLDNIRIFQKVADYRSFVAAARELRISAVAASRAIATLEEELGVRLLRRSTRSVSLTDQGIEYLDRTRRALSELDDAARAARGENACPRGALVITAPVMFGRMHVVPIVRQLLANYPELTMKLILVDRVVRLVEEGIDVAVRIAHLPDSCLRALPLATVRRIYVASPDYLIKRGTPKSAKDLVNHDIIIFDSAGLKSEHERSASRTQRPRFVTNSVDACIDIVTEGFGIAFLYSYHISHQLAEGRLIRVLPDIEGEDIPVSLVYEGDRQQSPNLGAFFSAAQAALPNKPSL